jgi:hypothetical protein
MSAKTSRASRETGRHVAALALLASVGVGAGCVNTDAAVFVDAGIDAPVVNVNQGALGTSVTGSFTVTLHLGARASGPSEVTFGAFAIEKADRSAVVVDSLPVTTSTSSPVGVDPDSDVEVDFAIDTGADPLPQAVVDGLCGGQLVVSGVLEDSLATKSTPIVSDAFLALGCAP